MIKTVFFALFFNFLFNDMVLSLDILYVFGLIYIDHILQFNKTIFNVFK